MSATLARQGGSAQLERSEMGLPFDRTEMANSWFSRAAIEDTHQRITTLWAESRDKNNQWGTYPGQNQGNVVIQWRPAKIRESQTNEFLPCQNYPGKNPLTHWRSKGTGAPWPQPTPPPPGMPPVPPGNTEESRCSEIDGAPPGYVYIYTRHPNAQFINRDVCAKSASAIEILV